MPMPRWEDEDEYLTYLGKVLERVHRDDPPPSVDDRLDRYTKKNWLDLFVESIGEADEPFFSNCRTAYEHNDLLVLGTLIRNQIREYVIQCALVWNIIEDWELDDE